MASPAAIVPLKFSVRYDAEGNPEIFVEGQVVLVEESDGRWTPHMKPSKTEHTSLTDLFKMKMHFLDGTVVRTSCEK